MDVEIGGFRGLGLPERDVSLVKHLMTYLLRFTRGLERLQETGNGGTRTTRHQAGKKNDKAGREAVVMPSLWVETFRCRSLVKDACRQSYEMNYAWGSQVRDRGNSLRKPHWIPVSIVRFPISGPPKRAFHYGSLCRVLSHLL